MSSPRAVLIDFDHTLFDTDRFFWMDVRRAFARFGIDPALWEETYEVVWPSGYSLDKHLAALAARTDGGPAPIRAEAVRSVLREAFSDLRAYLFPDTLPFLQEARRRGAELHLLSFGDPGWQAYKVRGCGIQGLFSRIHYIPAEQAKAAAVEAMGDDSRGLVAIDNNSAELDRMRERAPGLRTYWIDRVPPEGTEPGDEEARYRYREARKYRARTPEYPHHRCRSLEEIPL